MLAKSGVLQLANKQSHNGFSVIDGMTEARTAVKQMPLLKGTA